MTNHYWPLVLWYASVAHRCKLVSGAVYKHMRRLALSQVLWGASMASAVYGFQVACQHLGLDYTMQSNQLLPIKVQQQSACLCEGAVFACGWHCVCSSAEQNSSTEL